MATIKRRDFETSEEGLQCRQLLEAMEADKSFFTKSSFTSDTEHYPDNTMPFVETHMRFLAKHSEINPQHYISNLRVRSRRTA